MQASSAQAHQPQSQGARIMDRTARIATDQPQRITVALEALSEWLNSFNRFEGELAYTVAHFTDTSDNPYANLTVALDCTVTCSEFERIMVLNLDTGDDGGPQVITTTWVEDSLHSITQFFDTMTALVYQDHTLQLDAA
jgi:hypothetical protein